MTAKGTIKVEDGRRIAGAVVLNIDNVFHMQEEEKGKKKGNFEEQQIIENLGKLLYPTTLSRNKNKIQGGRRT